MGKEAKRRARRCFDGILTRVGTLRFAHPTRPPAQSYPRAALQTVTNPLLPETLQQSNSGIFPPIRCSRRFGFGCLGKGGMVRTLLASAALLLATAGISQADAWTRSDRLITARGNYYDR